MGLVVGLVLLQIEPVNVQQLVAARRIVPNCCRLLQIDPAIMQQSVAALRIASN